MRSHTPCARITQTPKKNDRKDLYFKSHPLKQINSMQNNHRIKYVEMASQLISCVKKKKCEIQNLLSQEENNTYRSSISHVEAFQSLRKLKKVERLMQIVCKIISLKNYQDQCQIYQDQQRFHKIIQQNQTQQNSLYFNESEQKLYNIQKEYVYKQILQQREVDQIKNLNQELDQNKQIRILKRQAKFVNLKLDQFNLPQSDIQPLKTRQPSPRNQKNKKQCMTRQNSTLQLLNQQFSWQATGKQKQQNSEVKNCYRKFIKRYKSILKISINSLNLLTHILYNNKLIEQKDSICQQIQQISSQFNQFYHDTNVQYQNNFFIKVKQKVHVLYNKIYQIYIQNNQKVKKIKKQLI